jgi:hypothetical protein
VLGVVVTSAADPASLAALALAAARGQALVFADVPPDVQDEWTLAKALGVSRALTTELASQGLTFDALGDEIDALTLAINAGHKVQVKAGDDVPTAPPLVCRPGEYLALTDVLGRLGPQLARRWAFTGQLTGSAARSTYRAAAGLFAPGSGPAVPWVFDAYPGERQFDDYAAARTQGVLDAARQREPARFEPAMATPGDKASLSTWRELAAGPEGARGLDASLVMVGTMGNWDFFQLRPGNAAPGDVPLLRQPALVYFVHSWSLQFGDKPITVGGRWLEHGAYAYVGSVHEPFLAAFVPPHLLAQRLAAGVPLGMAIRHDQAPLTSVWRVGLAGDPLITLGPLTATMGAVSSTDAQAIASAIGLSGPGPSTGAGTGPSTGTGTSTGTVTLASDEVGPLLKARNFEQGVATLALLGRDADIARLIAALLREQPKDVTPALARVAALPCFRASASTLFLDVAAIALGDSPAAPPDATSPLAPIADALWHTHAKRLAGTTASGTALSAAQARLLAANIRPWSLQRDAFEAARALLPHDGKDAAQRVFSRAKTLTKRPEILQQLDHAQTALLK